MGALEALAHRKIVFPHPNNGGCMTLSWLGCMGGAVQPNVGFGCGGQWQAETLSHGHNSCIIWDSLESLIDAPKGLAVIAVVFCQCPDLGPTIPLVLSHLPTSSVSHLLWYQPSPGQYQGPDSQQKSLCPHPRPRRGARCWHPHRRLRSLWALPH